MKSGIRKADLTAVSFINARPLVYGIEESPLFDVEYRVPSECAEQLKNKNTDCGLIPVVEYREDYRVVPDICIASEREVASVLLLGDIPLEEMETVRLDQASRTSATLVKLLFSRKYDMDVDFSTGGKKKITGRLVIGDRAVELRNRCDYQYDLAAEWKEWQGLPFVFAFWAYREGNLSVDHIDELKRIRSAGLENIDEIVKHCKNEFDFGEEFLHRYFTSCINYSLDDEKLKAIEVFFELASEENLIPSRPEIRLN